MPAILPVSSLRSYTEVLDEVAPGEPVFLTKNGHGKYAILSMEDYDKLAAEGRLLAELEAGRKSGEDHGWICGERVRSLFTNEATNAD